MFRTARELTRPSLSQEAQNTHDSGSESDNDEDTDRRQEPLTKADLHNMLKEATAEIKAHTAAELERHISGIKEDLEALNTRATQAESDITLLQSTSSQHGQDIYYLSDKIQYLEDSLEDLNNRSRRNNIRIRGLPEAVDADAILPTLRDLFHTILPDSTEQECDIERAHRALRPLALNPTSPRDVIVRMQHFATKEKIMAATRASPPKYGASTLAFFQDLAPSTLKKRRDLKPLTMALTKKGLKYRWGHPFKLQVRLDDQDHVLHHPAEMEDFATALGLQLFTGTQAADRYNTAHGEHHRAAQPPRNQAKKRPPPRAENTDPTAT
ncbi:Hypothetical predicted protein [Pelobates cultripes]|uniref:L1 transposable element RRM domain-containing protein n=1 Tax=Pelobates cultripes TaxID=61616 RepID=A0AAD1R0E3_PELCU|nr:Hypothetical predicted protein [Pelobates cultripes]